MDLLADDTKEIITHQELIMQLTNRIEEILKNYRHLTIREIYLSGEDVCKLVIITKRAFP